jgi:hypothetical protein
MSQYNDPTVVVNEFVGIRNTGQTKTRPVGSMETAENVNLHGITEEGAALSIEGRNGYALSQAFTDIQAAYQTQDEQRLFVIDDGTLKYVNSDFTTVNIKSGFNGDDVYFTEAGNDIFYSGNIKGVVKELTAYDYIPLATVPSVTTIEGSLYEGRYMVTATYTRVDGAEGGSPPAYVLDVTDGSALVIETVAPSGYDVNIYVSSANGSDMYWIYTGGTATIQWDSIEDLSYPLDREQYQKEPLPDNCTVIEFHEGKIWAADYSIDDDITAVRFSSPFWWHLYELYGDYIAVPGKVVMLESVPGGLVIGTDREIYVYTREEVLVKLADYGVVEGWPASIMDDGNTMFWTERGVCIALPFRNLTEEKVSLPPGIKCSTSIIREDGEERFIILTDGNGTADNAY